MATKEIYLEPNNFYHIYNRGNASENLFYSTENYNYFLKKYLEYVEPIASTYSYCLMPNHFHFLIKIKTETELFKFLKETGKIPELKLTQEDFEMMYLNSPPNLYSLHINKQFSNFFNGYSQAINKQQNRQGSLFLKQFKRKLITDELYLKNLIVYIHTNALHHNFTSNIIDWKFNSYHSIISNLPTKIKREDTIKLFENLENFIKVHNQKNTFNLEEDFNN